MREAEYVSMNRLTEICDGAGGMTKSPPNSRFCKDPAIWREVGFDQGWYKDGDGDVQLGERLNVFAQLKNRREVPDCKIVVMEELGCPVCQFGIFFANTTYHNKP